MSAPFDRVELTTLALNLARNAGYAVFPIGANKQPSISKEEGGNGLLDGTTDPEKIKQLFAHRNAHHVGVTTGAASGISVLDIDAGRWPDDAPAKTIEKHEAARAWWHANADRLPATRIYESASGGLHVYFRHRPGIVNTQSTIHMGVDTRGDGGYIVFWFASGYACRDHSPPADWPQWLFEILTTPKVETFRTSGGFRGGKHQSLAPDHEIVLERALRVVRSAGEGSKHTAVRSAAILLGGIQAAGRFSDATALAWIKDALPDTVKDWKNVEKTVESGLVLGRTKPIDVQRAG
ncbi:MAG TPA: bifunctional DNA primase/polymerase [Rhodopila sp.]|uniref:bifunctional DNA primase/polymerase n=1 Tax=Rhodopila sp. TaxID=2480087 RepID=UPI002C657785|nr:bifunctional DNA primase/polymerase [Rhodopila sp.]HVY14488.1 bifunctional DNA primase/polymerase [Rhodopila sp.]